MNEECYLFGEECEKEQHEECNKLFRMYAKVVFCADSGCAWNKPIEGKKVVKKFKGAKPFPNDFYSGVCVRPEIALDPRVIETLQTRHVLTTCAVRSAKIIGGHLDWSNLPQGGNIPDPVDPSTVYH